MDLTSYILATNYTDESLDGAGALKGVPCQIQSITDITGGKRITFLWVDNSENEHTSTLDVMNGDKGETGETGATGADGQPGQDGQDGRGIKRSYVDEDKHFIIVYTDDTEEDCGVITSVGGDSSLTSDLTAAVTIGGITNGTTFTAGTSLETILRTMLEPTLYPTLTAPSASMTYGADTYYPVGGTVSALNAVVSLNRGSINPAYGTSGYRSGTATGYSIATSGADTEYRNSSDSSGSFNVPSLTRATKGTIVVTGTVSYAVGEQPKDSKGNNYDSPLSAGSKSTSKTITFIQPYYYGVSNSSTVSDFTGLTENLSAKGQKTFNYTTDNHNPKKNVIKRHSV